MSEYLSQMKEIYSNKTDFKNKKQNQFVDPSLGASKMGSNIDSDQFLFFVFVCR